MDPKCQGLWTQNVRGRGPKMSGVIFELSTELRCKDIHLRLSATPDELVTGDMGVTGETRPFWPNMRPPVQTGLGSWATFLKPWEQTRARKWGQEGS